MVTRISLTINATRCTEKPPIVTEIKVATKLKFVLLSLIFFSFSLFAGPRSPVRLGTSHTFETARERLRERVGEIRSSERRYQEEISSMSSNLMAGQNDLSREQKNELVQRLVEMTKPEFYQGREEIAPDQNIAMIELILLSSGGEIIPMGLTRIEDLAELLRARRNLLRAYVGASFDSSFFRAEQSATKIVPSEFLPVMLGASKIELEHLSDAINHYRSRTGTTRSKSQEVFQEMFGKMATKYNQALTAGRAQILDPRVQDITQLHLRVDTLNEQLNQARSQGQETSLIESLINQASIRIEQIELDLLPVEDLDQSALPTEDQIDRDLFGSRGGIEHDWAE